jgi:hypothetical protein
MAETDLCVNKPHLSRSYLNRLVLTNQPNKQLTNKLTDWLTHSLTSWSIALLEKLIVPQLVKKFTAFYGM